MVYSCKYHVVCCPEYRRQVLVNGVAARLKESIIQTGRTLKSRLPTLWANSYFVSTVGGASLEIIKQYIENQKHV